MLNGFHSVVVDVDDFESAVDDYARMLGQEARWIEHNAERRSRSALFPLANTLLEIRNAEVATGDPSQGLSGFRLAWDEPDGFVRELKSAATLTQPCVSELAERSGIASTRRWTSTPLDRVVSRSISVELISGETGEQPVWEDRGADSAPATSIDPRSRILGLDHVVLFSADIEATRDFYAIRLGIRLALDRKFEKRGVRLIFLRIGGVTIEVGGRLDAEPQPERADRFGGLAWQVSDLEAVHSRLQEDRFDVSEIREGHKPGTRVCTVRDPVHGVPTLLIEPLS